MDCKYCLDKLNFKVKIADVETKCKYHKRIGQIYRPASFVDKGLCMELFYAAYSVCLSVLYSGRPSHLWLRKKGMQKVRVCCPHPQGVTVEIRYQEILPAPLRIVKELIEEILKVIYRPFDAHYRRVVMEVTEANSGCPKKYKAGDKFQFNTANKDELCPAGFAAVYPYLRLMNNPGVEKDSLTSMNVHCPDYAGVTYEIIVGY